METEIPDEVMIVPCSKNKWLYPDDPIGILERGVVYESKIYQYDISKPQIESGS